MDLREFIKEALVQISMRVQDAITDHQAEVGAKGVINPVWGADASAISAEHAQNVEFDVAVSERTAQSPASRPNRLSILGSMAGPWSFRSA